ncbi:transposase [Desulfosporosinus sp. SB140]|uniref:transposase n=1 Tax=Desulfosporosinus paludis TaxID=3115649 RepID=UPI00388E21A4
MECTNSALKRRHGMNRLKVRGLAKSQLVVGLKVTAQNFRRFCKHMLEIAKKLRKEDLGVALS